MEKLRSGGKYEVFSRGVNIQGGQTLLLFFLQSKPRTGKGPRSWFVLLPGSARGGVLPPKLSTCLPPEGPAVRIYSQPELTLEVSLPVSYSTGN